MKLAHLLCFVALGTLTTPAYADNPLKKLLGNLMQPPSKAEAKRDAQDDSALIGTGGAAVVNRLLANMVRAQLSFDGGIERTLKANTTAVAGLYEIVRGDTGQFVTYTNEPGTIALMGSEEFQLILAYGMRPLTPEEAASLRREMLARIDPSYLIRVTYGDGGGRQILLRSAIDCPACRQLEGQLAAHAKTLNSTFLVLPSSLAPMDDRDGPERWNRAAQLLCAANAGQAWKSYWVSQSVPNSSGCQHDGKTLHAVESQISQLFAATGDSGRNFVPRLYAEDGKELPAIQQSTQARHLEALYGRAGTPTAAPTNSQWLGGSAAPIAAPVTGVLQRIFECQSLDGMPAGSIDAALTANRIAADGSVSTLSAPIRVFGLGTRTVSSFRDGGESFFTTVFDNVDLRRVASAAGIRANSAGLYERDAGGGTLSVSQQGSSVELRCTVYFD